MTWLFMIALSVFMSWTQQNITTPKQDIAINRLNSFYDKQQDKSLSSGCWTIDSSFDGKRYYIDIYTCIDRLWFSVVYDLKNMVRERIWEINVIRYIEADEKLQLFYFSKN